MPRKSEHRALLAEARRQQRLKTMGLADYQTAQREERERIRAGADGYDVAISHEPHPGAWTELRIAA